MIIWNYEAVIFDLDGTLLDTLEDLADSMNAVLKSLGLPEHQLESYKLFVGDGIKEFSKRALPEKNRTSDEIAKVVGLVSKEYTLMWDKKTKPYKGIPELLDELTKRKIKKAILSNKPENFTLLTVKKLLPRWEFDVVLGESDNVPKKPDTKGAQRIAKQLGVPPEKIIYLGDTGTDMETAVAAGMYPVGAAWGFRDADELICHGAKIIINHPLDLLKLWGVPL